MSSPHVTWPGSVSYNYYYCGRFSSTCLGEEGGEEEKKITVLSGTRGQDSLSLSGVAHHSTADGLAASHLHEYPKILGVRNFRYPRAFHSQPQYRRIHKNVINSFSIGMVS